MPPPCTTLPSAPPAAVACVALCSTLGGLFVDLLIVFALQRIFAMMAWRASGVTARCARTADDQRAPPSGVPLPSRNETSARLPSW